MGNNTLKTVVIWLLALESWKKRLILLGFDSVVIPLSVLLALAARLESHNFLYQNDSYIACAVAFFCSMAVFFVRGFYNAFTRHISIDTALTIIVALASALLLALISFGGLKFPFGALYSCGFFGCWYCQPALFYRAIGQNISREARKNIAIYGAGIAG